MIEGGELESHGSKGYETICELGSICVNGSDLQGVRRNNTIFI